MEIIVKLAWLLAIDAVFIGLCIAILIPLFVFKRAAFAVTKRNFVGYFSNPTGYVFLCMFVALSSFAAFCSLASARILPLLRASGSYT